MSVRGRELGLRARDEVEPVEQADAKAENEEREPSAARLGDAQQGVSTAMYGVPEAVHATQVGAGASTDVFDGM